MISEQEGDVQETEKGLNDAAMRTKKVLKSKDSRLMADCAKEIENLLA